MTSDYKNNIINANFDCGGDYMKLNLTDYLYHGINYVDDVNGTIDNIISSGYILTRNSLKSYLDEVEYKRFLEDHGANWNGIDAVSISCHPDDKETIDQYQLLSAHDVDFDNAYKEYVRASSKALLLDKRLLEHYKLKQNSIKMNYEMQVIGDIPVEYIKAIACITSHRNYSKQQLNNFSKVLCELNRNVKGRQFVRHYMEGCAIREDFYQYSIDEIIDKKIEPLYRVQKVLEKHGLNIPIIDIDYGYELPPFEQQKKRIKRIAKNYYEYCESKGYSLR